MAKLQLLSPTLHARKGPRCRLSTEYTGNDALAMHAGVRWTVPLPPHDSLVALLRDSAESASVGLLWISLQPINSHENYFVMRQMQLKMWVWG